MQFVLTKAYNQSQLMHSWNITKKITHYFCVVGANYTIVIDQDVGLYVICHIVCICVVHISS